MDMRLTAGRSRPCSRGRRKNAELDCLLVSAARQGTVAAIIDGA